MRRPDGGVVLVVQSLRRPLCPGRSPLPRLSGPVFGIISTISALGGLATLVAGALAMRDAVPALVGERAPADEVARVCGRIDPGGRRGLPDRDRVTGDEGAATVGALVVALRAIPVAIGIAVTRYRLYEIDRLINRTLVYAGLSAGLAAVFAAVSLSLGVASARARRCRRRQRPSRSALLFGPLRRAHPAAGRPALRPRPLRRAAHGRALPRGPARRARGAGGDG